MKQRRQSGFAGLELVLILAVVAVLGFVAFKAYDANQKGAQSQVTADVPEAPSINATADLTVAEQTVDSVDLDADSSDNETLDTQLSAF